MGKVNGCFSAVLLMASIAFGSAAHGQSSSDRSYDFDFFPALDIPLLIGTGTTWLVPAFIGKELPQNFCAPCDPDNLNALDRTVLNFGYPWARTASDATWLAIMVAGAGLSAYGGRRFGAKEALTDIALIAESLVITGALHQIVRRVFHRPRPYMYQDPLDEDYRKDGDDDWLSFFSGHTATAFAAATTFSYVFSRRRGADEDQWPGIAVWAGSMTFAAFTGLWRVLAADHFWTDMLTGAAIGTAIGLIVPVLHQSEIVSDGLEPQAQVSTNTLMVGFSF